MRIPMLKLVSVGLVAVVVTGARDQGCVGPLETDRSDQHFGEKADAGEQECPALACRLSCPNGLAVGDDGCSLCACADEPATISCWTDSDCREGVCDVVNYCDPPPGCDPGEGCPPVCYGRCVASASSDEELCRASNGRWDTASCGHYFCGRAPDCEALIPGCDCGEGSSFAVGQGCVASSACKQECAGAFADGRGHCLGPAEQTMPSYCCQAPCDDGSVLVCRMMQPACAAPLVAAVHDGCWVCADPLNECRVGCASDDDCQSSQRCTAAAGDCDAATNACEQPRGVCLPRYAGCLGDAECPQGEICLPTPGAPCRDDDPTCVPVVGRCVASSECQPVACDLWCEDGFKIDATGCETCTCNEEPPGCLCTEEYAPACGANGRTYSNACHAACANVRVVSAGACRACNIQCLVADPVCGTDGVTYGCGEVEARCHGVEVASPGACRACTSGTDCAWGQKCLVAADGAARCVDVTYCESDEDCTGLARPDASGTTWACEANVCTAR